jgi:hypothetical protein
MRRPQNKIIFIHVPKCGGDAVANAIVSQYITLRGNSNPITIDAVSSDNVVKIRKNVSEPAYIAHEDVILELRENLLLYFMGRASSRLIIGHVAFSNAAYEAFRGQFAFVTMLRDPVKRYISAYFYNRYKTIEHRKINLEIDAYLDSELGRAQGHDLVKFIGGRRDNGDYASREAIDQAKENLHKFDVVGLLEHLDTFRACYETRFGVSLRLAKMNESPKPTSSRDSIMTTERREKVRELCAPDREIYQYAMEHFLSREHYSE